MERACWTDRFTSIPECPDIKKMQSTAQVYNLIADRFWLNLAIVKNSQLTRYRSPAMRHLRTFFGEGRVIRCDLLIFWIAANTLGNRRLVAYIAMASMWLVRFLEKPQLCTWHTNVFNLFNRHKRRKRSHGRRRNSRRNGEITLKQFYNLYNNGRGGLHQLLTALHSTRLPNLHKLHNECKQLRIANRDQRFKRIVLDVCSKKLFPGYRYAPVVPPTLYPKGVLSRSTFTIKGLIK